MDPTIFIATKIFIVTVFRFCKEALGLIHKMEWVFNDAFNDQR